MSNNSKLKILHVLDHSLPLHSGYTFRSKNIFRMQVKKDWQPVVLTSSKHEENINKEGKGKEQYSSLEIIEGIRYYRTGLLPVSSLPIIPDLRIVSSLESRLEEIAYSGELDQ